MLFFTILFGLTIGLSVTLGYIVLGMILTEKIWDSSPLSPLYTYLGYVFVTFWICVPISLALYLETILSAVSSAG